MMRVCSVCSLMVNFNIDFCFSEMRKFYWIKSISAYIHAHRKKEFRRFHERNFENFKLLTQVLEGYSWQNIFIYASIFIFMNFYWGN